MQFNSQANNQDLVSDTRWWISGSVSGATDYAINDITRSINYYYDQAGALIMRNDNRWEFDDNNAQNLPIGVSNLIANQPDYEIAASEVLKIIRVEIKDRQGSWKSLAPADLRSADGRSLDERFGTSGDPISYAKMANSIILLPTPSYSSTNGLKIYLQRNLSYFLPTDTTKEPGFNRQFHRYLSMGAAIDYCLVNGLNNKLALLNREMAKMEQAIEEFYSSRSEKDERLIFTLHQENYGQKADFASGGGENYIDWTI